MQAIPKDIFEPSMRFDIFGVIGIDVAASVVAPGGCSEIAGLVPAGTETLTLLLDHPTHEVLATTRNWRFGREGECRAVVEDVEFGLSTTTFFGQERSVAVQTLLALVMAIF